MKTKGIIIEKEESTLSLLNDERFISPQKAIAIAPSDKPGIYCFKIKSPQILPLECQDAIRERGHNILYIGVAKKLKRRLEQELMGKGHGTFFRTFGAIFDFVPPRGSLANRKNKNNYKFSDFDEKEIIRIINNNLSVSYITTCETNKVLEKELIAELLPIMNIQNNPAALEVVKRRREECKRIANE